MRPPRRGGRAVECTGLENRHPRKRIVGSNPTLSARTTTSKNLTNWRANPSLDVHSRSRGRRRERFDYIRPNDVEERIAP